jgi:hypothetical protein
MQGMFQTIIENNITLFQNFAKTTTLLEKMDWQMANFIGKF